MTNYSTEFKALVLRQGTMLGFHENKGFLYKLNGSFYIYKGGEIKQVLSN